MKKRIAILFESTGGGNYGAQYATIERIKHLKAISHYDIDVYMLEEYPCFLPRILKHTKKKVKYKTRCIDGLTVRVLWLDFLLVDYLFEFKLGVLPFFRNRSFKKFAKIFCQYDLVSAHLLHCGEIAMIAKQQYSIPFTMTWHGSDININPWITKNIYNRTREVMEKTDMNFFVSKALLGKSVEITGQASKMVLYNGVDKTKYYKYSQEQRFLARQKYGIHGNCYNIAFVGHLVPVKNVMCLPDVFELIKKQIPEAKFHVAGDGILQRQLKALCLARGIVVDFHGKIEQNEMPDFYNAIDLMVLPSFNEGLPLVVVEAKACGTDVVASRVGGIAEVIGIDNTIVLDDHFNQNMATKCVEKYGSCQTMPLDQVFDWNKTALSENKVYQTILADGRKEEEKRK